MAGIKLEAVHYSYNRDEVESRALDNVCMEVKQGSIYGLLGPSGSGKTTLLHVIMGSIKPTAGRVKVLPGEPIPGPGVGFMPQSLSLHQFFTTREILVYYGRLAGMDPGHIEAQSTHYLGLLNLQEKGKSQLMNLSGGQQRRLSFACALISTPPLLLLDEPTVGTDPLLRKEIWDTLEDLAYRGTTIVITTHYLEEAIRANRVGLMRQGKLLVEGRPEDLLVKYNTATMDQLLLRICSIHSGLEEETSLVHHQEDQAANQEENILQQQNLAELLDIETQVKRNPGQPVPTQRNPAQAVPTQSKLSALLYKNLKVLRRHRIFMFFNTILPIITFLIFFASVGRPLQDLKVGYSNDDSNCEQEINFCTVSSCNILTGLRQTGQLILTEYANKTMLDRALYLGHQQAAIYFPVEFSTGFHISFLELLSNSTRSKVILQQDWSSREVGETIKRVFVENLVNYKMELYNLCRVGIPPQELLALTAVHGSSEMSGHLTMLPAMVVITLHFLAVALTADQMVTEKESGLLQRDWTAGVPPTLSIAAQFTVQSSVVLAQIVLSLLMLVYLYTPPVGVIVLLLLLIFLLCLCGMVLGAGLSLACQSREQVINLAVGIIFPSFLLAGVLWPRISMPYVLQVAAEMLPLTASCDVARELLLKGSVQFELVAKAVGVPLVWIAIFITIVKCFLTKTHY